MIIGLIGKFNNLHDEEYIARSFEMLGHRVIRIEQTQGEDYIHRKIVLTQPNILIFTKWNYGAVGFDAIKRGREWGMKTVCWLFDLYWNYEREYRITKDSYFKADYVFTTDGGNDDKWKAMKINHHCVRQGIYEPECKILQLEDPQGIAFIGSENPFFTERTEMIRRVEKNYPNFRWYGKNNTNAVRGMDLNKIFSRIKIIIGDSVPSPQYWSNRVVETLGRGGFLIHRNVEGIKEEYPNLVTYDGTFEDLKKKIDYYLEHEDERLSIIKKNHALVKSKYTMDKKCKELLNYIS